jgi:argininosuccinate lyase
MSRMWDKGDPLDQQVLAYTAGEDHQLDNRLVPYDVRASIAHARMLNASDLLSAEHLGQIEAGLGELAAAHARGEWRIGLDEEDVHNALEHRLSLVYPEAAARVHLGRSRNDQVLVALRLYLKDTAQSLHDGALQVAAALEYARGAGKKHAAARLHPPAAGHAELRAPVGRGLRRRAAR